VGRSYAGGLRAAAQQFLVRIDVGEAVEKDGGIDAFAVYGAALPTRCGDAAPAAYFQN